MKLVLALLVAIAVALAILTQFPASVSQQPRQQEYVGHLVALVVDCAPGAQDCRPRTEYYLDTGNGTLPLDLSNAVIQVPLSEYVGNPGKKVRAVGVLESGVLKVRLLAPA